jgi:hypothetical protein
MPRRSPLPPTAAVPALPHPEPAGSSISYGWTRWGQVGQTKARVNRFTGELEVRDGENWIRCHPDCVEFFTPRDPEPSSLA